MQYVSNLTFTRFQNMFLTQHNLKNVFVFFCRSISGQDRRHYPPAKTVSSPCHRWRFGRPMTHTYRLQTLVYPDFTYRCTAAELCCVRSCSLPLKLRISDLCDCLINDEGGKGNWFKYGTFEVNSSNKCYWLYLNLFNLWREINWWEL